MRTGLFRTYHYGSHKWEDYLLDIQEAQDEASQAAIDASQEANEELRRHTELLDRQVQLSTEINDSLGEIKLEMQFGFGLVVDRLDQQIQLVSDIIRSLDAIHQTLQSPLITQANELWRLGEERFRKGLYDRALDAFLQSEQKNEVLFPLQLRIGTLLLEGRNAECNVINLAEAERHLLLAARYAQAEQKTTANWQEFAGRAYYRAAQAAYLIGKESAANGNPTLTRECLERSSHYLERAAKIWPEFRGAMYLYAKCQALLGNNKQALGAIEVLSDTDRQFYSAAQDDGDFSGIRQHVEEVFRQAIDHPGPNAAKAMESLARAKVGLNWIRLSNPQAAQDKQALKDYERNLSTIEKQLNTLDVDIDAATAQLLEFRRDVERFAERLMLTEEESLARIVTSLNSTKASIEGNLSHLRSQKALTEGSSGIGCLSVIVMFVVLQVGLPIIVLPFKQQLSGIPMGFLGGLLFLGGLVVYGIISFKMGKALSRHNRNVPLLRSIEQAESSLKEWELSAPATIAKAEGDSRSLNGRLHEFHEWQAADPFPVAVPDSDVQPVASPSSPHLLFKAVLTSAGFNLIETIKAVREITQFDLSHAKNCVENLPSLLKRDLNGTDAAAIKKRFADIGAEVTVQIQH